MPKSNVFMIMPFDPMFFEVYEMLKEHFIDEFEFTHAGDDVKTQQNILKDIVQMIYDSDVVVAELTGLNPNVFYELGIAHTLNKKVIVITQDLSQLPFDIKSYRTTEYSTHFKKFDILIKEITRYLKGAVDGSIIFGNPVSDFLTTIDKASLATLLEKADESKEENAERGFLDFLADIEEQMGEMTDSITELTTDLQAMSSGINDSTVEMERVQKVGGSGTASFMRKEARKAATHISTYSVNLKKNNAVLTELWPQIEKNCLLLLENKHINLPDNKEGLIFFLKSLVGLQQAAITTSSQTESMMKSMLDNKGFQSSLNQAINSIDIDMKHFLNFNAQICASIDRIVEKSRFVVGEINFDETAESDEQVGK